MMNQNHSSKRPLARDTMAYILAGAARGCGS